MIISWYSLTTLSANPRKLSNTLKHFKRQPHKTAKYTLKHFKRQSHKTAKYTQTL